MSVEGGIPGRKRKSPLWASSDMRHGHGPLEGQEGPPVISLISSFPRVLTWSVCPSPWSKRSPCGRVTLNMEKRQMHTAGSQEVRGPTPAPHITGQERKAKSTGPETIAPQVRTPAVGAPASVPRHFLIIYFRKFDGAPSASLAICLYKTLRNLKIHEIQTSKNDSFSLLL